MLRSSSIEPYRYVSILMCLTMAEPYLVLRRLNSSVFNCRMLRAPRRVFRAVLHYASMFQVLRCPCDLHAMIFPRTTPAHSGSGSLKEGYDLLLCT